MTSLVDFTRLDFLHQCISKMNHSGRIYNNYVKCLIKVINLYHDKDNKYLSKIPEAIEFLEKSISLFPSYSNNTYKLKLELFYIYKKNFNSIKPIKSSSQPKTKSPNILDETTIVRKTKEFIDEIKNANKWHTLYADLRVSYFNIFLTGDTVEKIVTEFKSIIEQVDINTKKHISNTFSNLYVQDTFLESEIIQNNTIDRFFQETNLSHDLDPIYFINKAKYLVAKQKDNYIKFADEILMTQFQTCIEKRLSEELINIFNLLSLLPTSNNKFNELYDQLKDVKNIFTKDEWLNLQIVHLEKNEYYNEIVKLFHLELDRTPISPTQFTQKMFFYLKCHKYKDVIEETKAFLEQKNVHSSRTEAALYVNYAIALKNINSSILQADIKEKLKYLVSQKPDDDESICLKLLLDNHSQAVALLKKKILSNYWNYFTFKRWPAIEEHVWKEIEKKMSNPENICMIQ